MKAHNKTRFVAVTSVLCIDEDWDDKPWYAKRGDKVGEAYAVHRALPACYRCVITFRLHRCLQ